jgi:hypothetical protein
MALTFIGTTFSITEPYGPSEIETLKTIQLQIEEQFPNDNNLLISLTWFGPQFDNDSWQQIEDFSKSKVKVDNLFLLATVDPPMITVTDIQQIKMLTDALHVYLLGNFDSPHAFNFFAPTVAKNFKFYTDDDLLLKHCQYRYISYNRKPKPHRIQLVNMLYDQNLNTLGIITLGKDESNIHNQNQLHKYISLGEQQKDYIDRGNHPDHWGFGIPLDNFSLHRLDLWQESFLFVTGATEANPVNDLFCQQDTFKPMLGLRPFVINGSQKTYHWLKYHGFQTFNNYWPHIDIESGEVQETIVSVIKFLATKSSNELLSMYQDMLPKLHHNKNRFFEFAEEQQYKIHHLF